MSIRIASEVMNRGGKTARWFRQTEFAEIAVGTHPTNILRRSFANAGLFLEKTIMSKAHLTCTRAGQEWKMAPAIASRTI